MVQSVSSSNVSTNYGNRNCTGCKKPAFGLSYYEKPESSTKKTLKRMGGQFVFGAVVSAIFDAVRAGYNYITKAPQQSLKSIGANAAVLGLAFVAIDSVMNLYYKHKAKKVIEEHNKMIKEKIERPV